MWSKIKACLRKLKAKTKETLEAAIKQAFESIEISDIFGWFKENGYSTQ
jgi:hypothetical protein